MTEIERLERADPDEFYRDFVLPRRPAVIENAIHWPAHDTWTLEGFAERFADRTVEIEGENWRMADFMERVRHSTPESPAPYLNGVPIAEVFPELVPELQPAPPITRPNWLTSPRMPARWNTRDGFLELLIAGHGTCFPGLHYDQWYLNAIVTQVVGDKDFYVFRPEDTRYLYPRPDAPNRSPIKDIRNVDLDVYPDFAKATPIHVRLRRGETIFVPWGWWHITEMPGPSIAVSINSANAGNWREFGSDFARRSSPIKRALIHLALRGVAIAERRH